MHILELPEQAHVRKKTPMSIFARIKTDRLKKFLAILFLFSFVGQTFGQVLIVAGYYMNTASFSKNCVNKDKPLLHCNGKCQMMKKMVQEEKKDQQDPGRKTESKIIVLSSRSFFATAPFLPAGLYRVYAGMKGGYPVDHPLDVFHPPQC